MKKEKVDDGIFFKLPKSMKEELVNKCEMESKMISKVMRNLVREYLKDDKKEKD